MLTTLAEWVTVIGLPLIIIQTIYISLTYHNSKIAQATGAPPRTSYRHLLIMSILAVISWGVFAVGQFLRKPETIFADSIVNEWKYRDGVFEVDVRGEPLLQFKKDYNLVLYVKPPIPGADRMADAHGIKSEPYTIHDGIIYLTGHINKEFCSFYNGPFGGAELIVVLLPKKFSPEQITSLASIETMEGKIVAHPGWPTNYPPECKTLK